MKLLLSSREQLRSNWKMIALILIISAFLLSTALLLHLWKGIPVGNLTRDPNAIVGAPFYNGFISQIGIFFWSASAAICIFSAKIITKGHDSLNIKSFLFFSGLLTLALSLDDAFQLHEGVLPYLGVPEEVVIAVYAGFLIFYLIRFYSVILNTQYILLVIALVFFGVSIILDLFNIPFLSSNLFEDGAKMAGIVSWFFYFFRVGKAAVSCRIVPFSV